MRASRASEASAPYETQQKAQEDGAAKQAMATNEVKSPK